jgi:hypothetical protein
MTQYPTILWLCSVTGTICSMVRTKNMFMHFSTGNYIESNYIESCRCFNNADFAVMSFYLGY